MSNQRQPHLSANCFALLCVALSVLMAGTPLRAQDQPRAPEAAIANVSAAVTGWNSVNSVRLSVEIADPNKPGSFQAMNPNHEFLDGQKFRVRLTSDVDLHVYVLVHNADNTRVVLEPEKPGQLTKLKAKQTLLVPETGTFKFELPAGKERLRVIASPEPLPWIDAEQLFEIRNGDTLTEQELAAQSQLKSLKASDVPKALQHATGLKSAKSLGAAARDIEKGNIPRGTRYLIVDDQRTEQVISLTSPEKNDRAILVHDFELIHK